MDAPSHPFTVLCVGSFHNRALGGNPAETLPRLHWAEKSSMLTAGVPPAHVASSPSRLRLVRVVLIPWTASHCVFILSSSDGCIGLY